MLRSILMYVLGLAIGLGFLALVNTQPVVAIVILIVGGIVWFVERSTRAARLSHTLWQVDEWGMQNARIGQSIYRGIQCPRCFKLLRTREDYDPVAFKKGVLECGHCKQEIRLDLNALRKR